jgi:hypothetical protein
MANNHFLATLYGEVQTFDGINGPIVIYGNGYPTPLYRSFPSTGVEIKGVSPAQVLTTAFGTVNVNSIVEVLPTGLANTGKKIRYVSDATVAALNTEAT